MRLQRKHKQTGISFIGMSLVAVTLASAGVVAAQVFPTVLEYQAINKALEAAKRAQTASEARMIFDKAAAIDDIHSLSGRDIEIIQENGKMVLRFAYEREIHLAGPAYLTLKYAGSTK